jgi:hypothetical protein
MTKQLDNIAMQINPKVLEVLVSRELSRDRGKNGSNGSLISLSEFSFVLVTSSFSLGFLFISKWISNSTLHRLSITGQLIAHMLVRSLISMTRMSLPLLCSILLSLNIRVIRARVGIFILSVRVRCGFLQKRIKLQDFQALILCFIIIMCDFQNMGFLRSIWALHMVVPPPLAALKTRNLCSIVTLTQKMALLKALGTAKRPRVRPSINRCSISIKNTPGGLVSASNLSTLSFNFLCDGVDFLVQVLRRHNSIDCLILNSRFHRFLYTLGSTAYHSITHVSIQVLDEVDFLLLRRQVQLLEVAQHVSGILANGQLVLLVIDHL